MLKGAYSMIGIYSRDARVFEHLQINIYTTEADEIHLIISIDTEKLLTHDKEYLTQWV